MIRIGTAGWSIAARYGHLFPETGSGLERYAARFDAVEINSTFYRSHKPQTYARWAEAVPDDFRFAVKLPRTITHEQRLIHVEDILVDFLAEASLLGPKLGPLLVQLPPSFTFDAAVADTFFCLLRSRTGGAVACEPRHPSWFQSEADRLLARHDIARVAADPARVPEAAVPGGTKSLVYVRLHGAPRMYYSAYDESFLADLAQRLATCAAAESWCTFDNTVSGAALGNALGLRERIGSGPPVRPELD